MFITTAPFTSKKIRVNRNVVIDVRHGRGCSNISEPLCGKGGTKQKASVVKQTEKNSHKNIYGLIGELGKYKGSNGVRCTCRLVQEEGVWDI